MQRKTWHPVHLTHTACSWDHKFRLLNRTLDARFHTFRLLVISCYFRHPVVRNLVAEDVRDEFVKDFTQEEQKEDAKNLTQLSGIDSKCFQVWKDRLKCIPAYCCKHSFVQTGSTAACYWTFILGKLACSKKQLRMGTEELGISMEEQAS